MKKRNYMNPYLAGILLGLVLLASFYLTGRGLGASGAMKSVVISGIEKVSESHVAESKFYSGYVDPASSPLKTWLVLEVFGVLVGGFISGAISGRLTWKVEKSPKISNKRRLIFALVGGAFFGFGSQLGRGCTSGAALTGMAVLSVAGFVTMMAIFGTAFALAYFFRKNWI